MLDFLITSTSAFPKTTLHHEGNITHSSLPSIMKESTKTNPLKITT
jgi:hypothetical protein